MKTEKTPRYFNNSNLQALKNTDNEDTQNQFNTRMFNNQLNITDTEDIFIQKVMDKGYDKNEANKRVTAFVMMGLFNVPNQVSSIHHNMSKEDDKILKKSMTEAFDMMPISQLENVMHAILIHQMPSLTDARYYEKDTNGYPVLKNDSMYDISQYGEERFSTPENTLGFFRDTINNLEEAKKFDDCDRNDLKEGFQILIDTYLKNLDTTVSDSL